MRILLAEDEKALSKALVKIFESSNYSIDAVFDGQEALDYLEAGNYDVAVLDIMMPKVDGITTKCWASTAEPTIILRSLSMLKNFSQLYERSHVAEAIRIQSFALATSRSTEPALSLLRQRAA